MIETIGDLLHAIYDVQGLIEWGGTLLVSLIIFVETGLFVGFFLPGDSLLVTAGVFAAAGVLRLSALLVFVTACAVLGDQVGYWIGRKAGLALYRRPDSFFFRKKHLDRAHRFYEEYGGMAVILARFIPIIRTFCPVVAGIAEMKYSRFVAYNVVGGFVWVFGMVLSGFFLGSLVPNIEQQIHWVIAVVIVVSFLPPLIPALRARRRAAAARAALSAGQSPAGQSEES